MCSYCNCIGCVKMLGMACAYCDLCVLHGQSRVLSGHRRDFLFTFSLASRSTLMRDAILTCATQNKRLRELRELMFVKTGLKLLNRYRCMWKMLKYSMKPTWSQMYGATQVKMYPGRIGNKLWASLLMCVHDYQWRSLNLGLHMSVRAIIIMRNRMKKIPSHLTFVVVVEKTTGAECFITILTDTSVVTSSRHLGNSCTDMHTQGMRSVCACVCVRLWC